MSWMMARPCRASFCTARSYILMPSHEAAGAAITAYHDALTRHRPAKSLTDIGSVITRMQGAKRAIRDWEIASDEADLRRNGGILCGGAAPPIMPHQWPTFDSGRRRDQGAGRQRGGARRGPGAAQGARPGPRRLEVDGSGQVTFGPIMMSPGAERPRLCPREPGHAPASSGDPPPYRDCIVGSFVTDECCLAVCCKLRLR